MAERWRELDAQAREEIHAYEAAINARTTRRQEKDLIIPKSGTLARVAKAAGSGRQHACVLQNSLETTLTEQSGTQRTETRGLLLNKHGSRAKLNNLCSISNVDSILGSKLTMSCRVI